MLLVTYSFGCLRHLLILCVTLYAQFLSALCTSCWLLVFRHFIVVVDESVLTS
jgi:hypothetical protein